MNIRGICSKRIDVCLLPGSGKAGSTRRNTGSNNSARYFEYYFGKRPHVIRKNRNSVAIISGNETTEEKHNLGKDIFTYFGMGCRSVTHLFLPVGYDLVNLIPDFHAFEVTVACC